MSWKDKFPKENRYFETENGILYCANNIDILKQFPNNIIDTLLTDPPYGLKFMGKKWDYNVPSTNTWKETLRILKPGATALIFAGSRTQHRMAVNIEDAGFILKDTLMWLYGSGFPKATDISKQIDKKFGAERKIIGYEKNEKDFRSLGLRTKEIHGLDKLGVGIHAERKQLEITKPTTPEAKLWNGYKTHGLKPAYEPIIMAMKPNDGSYVDNALKWGVAGLNIEAGRIGTEKVNVHDAPKGTFAGGEQGRGSIKNYREHQGRFPSNVLLDEESAKMLDEQSGISKSNPKPRHRKEKGMWHNLLSNNPVEYSDKGGASRFFYVAKASKKERNMGLEKLPIKRPDERTKTGRGSFEEKGIQPQQNHHPTVKPLKLMEYLIKLTTMPNPNQIFLDPFFGSGTTGIACENLGRKWIGIELNPEYCEIAKQRIQNIIKQKKINKWLK